MNEMRQAEQVEREREHEQAKKAKDNKEQLEREALLEKEEEAQKAA